MSDVEAYRRLAGEAESRLTQTREKLTMDERRENFPFAEQYERTMWQGGRPGKPELMNPFGLDVPAKETIAYTQFGQSFQPKNDPLMQFLGLTAPADDPIVRFVGSLGK